MLLIRIMETKGPPVHVRFSGYAHDWITETARKNRISKPDLIRAIVSEKMEALGIRPPENRIDYGDGKKPITAAEIVRKSREVKRP